jgi:hypothetical protein
MLSKRTHRNTQGHIILINNIMAKKEMLAPRGAIEKIAKETGHSRQWVGVCLKGGINSESAEKIRKVAKKYGCR